MVYRAQFGKLDFLDRLSQELVRIQEATKKTLKVTKDSNVSASN